MNATADGLDMRMCKGNDDETSKKGGDQMYISPIELQMQNLNNIVMQTTEDGIVKAVWNMGFKVNAEQLACALTQDRKRYEYAYDQGWNDCKQYYEEKLKKISELATNSNQEE